jgi:hypothetical protein
MKPTTCCLIFSYFLRFRTSLETRRLDKLDNAPLSSLSFYSVGRQKNTHKMHTPHSGQREGEKRRASEHQANGFKSRKCCFHFDYKLIGYRILKSRLVHAFFDLRGLWLSLSVKNIYI